MANGERQPSTVYVEYQNGRRTPGYADFHPSHRNRPRGEMQALFMEDTRGTQISKAMSTLSDLRREIGLERDT